MIGILEFFAYLGLGVLLLLLSPMLIGLFRILFGLAIVGIELMIMGVMLCIGFIQALFTGEIRVFFADDEGDHTETHIGGRIVDVYQLRIGYTTHEFDIATFPRRDGDVRIHFTVDKDDIATHSVHLKGKVPGNLIVTYEGPINVSSLVKTGGNITLRRKRLGDTDDLPTA